jgi:hypothetical protein
MCCPKSGPKTCPCASGPDLVHVHFCVRTIGEYEFPDSGFMCCPKSGPKITVCPNFCMNM